MSRACVCRCRPIANNAAVDAAYLNKNVSLKQLFASAQQLDEVMGHTSAIVELHGIVIGGIFAGTRTCPRIGTGLRGWAALISDVKPLSAMRMKIFLVCSASIY